MPQQIICRSCFSLPRQEVSSEENICGQVHLPGTWGDHTVECACLQCDGEDEQITNHANDTCTVEGSNLKSWKGYLGQGATLKQDVGGL